MRNVALAVSKVGYVHLRSIERLVVDRDATDRTVIVTFQPLKLAPLTLAGLGYKLADLNPARTVIVAELPQPMCWVCTGYLAALKKIAAVAAGVDNAAEAYAPDACMCPM